MSEKLYYIQKVQNESEEEWEREEKQHTFILDFFYANLLLGVP